MIVISDTTPIISLLKAGKLELLQKLYGRVLIPPAVYRELTTNPSFETEADIIRATDYLQVNVRHIGTAGILMLAYDKGLISAIEVKKCVDTMLVQHCTNIDEFCTRYFRQYCVVVNRRCHRIASFRRLVLTKISGAFIHHHLCNAVLVNEIRLDRKICNVIMDHIGLKVIY